MVEGVGARLWQADGVQLTQAPLWPIPDRAMTVSHLRIIILSVSPGSMNSGSSFPFFSQPMLSARLLAEWFLWMIFLKEIRGDLSVGVDWV